MPEREGLYEIVVRSRTMCPLAVGLTIQSRQDNDPHGFEAVLLCNPLKEIQARNLGQIEIENKDIRERKLLAVTEPPPTETLSRAKDGDVVEG